METKLFNGCPEPRMGKGLAAAEQEVWVDGNGLKLIAMTAAQQLFTLQKLPDLHTLAA